MVTKGIITYIPPEMEDELKSVMTRMNLKSRSDAFRVIVHNNRVSQSLLQTMEFHTKKFWDVKNRRR